MRVAAQAHADEVVLRVHNDGPPISEDAMKKIFEPMVRQPTQNGDNHTTGLGLGLYIAREIVTAHGGTIAVTTPEKDGTTFTVQIPRRHPQKPTKADVAQKSSKVSKRSRHQRKV